MTIRHLCMPFLESRMLGLPGNDIISWQYPNMAVTYAKSPGRIQLITPRQKILRTCRTSIINLQWHGVSYNQECNTILCDFSTGCQHPFIPVFLHRHEFDLIHGLFHPSECSTVNLIRQKLIWYGISSDAKHWTRACIPCQPNKVPRHTEPGIGDFHPPSRRPRAFIHVKRGRRFDGLIILVLLKD